MVTVGCLSATAAPIASVLAKRSTLLTHIRRLLEERPGADDKRSRALARQIVFGAPARTGATAQSATDWSEARLASIIQANIAADHAAWRLVDVGRWQISATEARALELMDCLSSARVLA
jgi:hypothetical protein